MPGISRMPKGVLREIGIKIKRVTSEVNMRRPKWKVRTPYRNSIETSFSMGKLRAI